MVALFEQASTLGRVEHQLTRFSCGTWRPGQEGGDFDVSWRGRGARVKRDRNKTKREITEKTRRIITFGMCSVYILL